MADRPEVRHLERIWLFAGCSATDLRRLRKVLTQVRVPAGTLLVEEGQPGLLFFIVEVTTLGPGHFFGELSLLDDAPRAASVTSDTDMTLLVLRQRDFQKLLRATPTIARRLLDSLAGRLRESEALVHEWTPAQGPVPPGQTSGVAAPIGPMSG